MNRAVLPIVLTSMVSFYALPAAGAEPPQVLSWIATSTPVWSIDSDANGFIYYTEGKEFHKTTPLWEEVDSWMTDQCSPYGIALDSRYIYVTDKNSDAGCPDHNIFQYDLAGNLVSSWCPTRPVENRCDAHRIALDPAGNLFAMDETGLNKFDSGGNLLASWESTDEAVQKLRGIAIGPDGSVFVTERKMGTVLRFDSELSGFQEVINNGTGFYPEGITIDDAGNLYVVTERKGVWQYDAHGNLVTVLWYGGTDVVVDRSGYIYVSSKTGIIKYDNKPGPPPPPPHPPAMMLHVGPVARAALGCETVPENPAHLVTKGTLDAAGRAVFFVYILGTPETRYGSGGILGMQLGLEYTQRGASPELNLQGWNVCSALDFPQDDWPASGTGNTITWVRCPYKEVTLAGYLYLSAYTPTAMSIVGFPTPDPRNPANGKAKMSGCAATEIILPKSRLGWVSFGGGGRNGDIDGCNPVLEPCDAGPVTVQPTTWGRIKSQYR